MTQELYRAAWETSFAIAIQADEPAIIDLGEVVAGFDPGMPGERMAFVVMTRRDDVFTVVDTWTTPRSETT